jgi:hypothetical protein
MPSWRKAQEVWIIDRFTPAYRGFRQVSGCPSGQFFERRPSAFGEVRKSEHGIVVSRESPIGAKDCGDAVGGAVAGLLNGISVCGNTPALLQEGIERLLSLLRRHARTT